VVAKFTVKELTKDKTINRVGKVVGEDSLFARLTSSLLFLLSSVSSVSDLMVSSSVGRNAIDVT
jgi:hypothetical protein